MSAQPTLRDIRAQAHQVSIAVSNHTIALRLQRLIELHFCYTKSHFPTNPLLIYDKKNYCDSLLIHAKNLEEKLYPNENPQ